MRNPETVFVNPDAPNPAKGSFADIFTGKKITEIEAAAVNILSQPQFGELNTEQKMVIFNFSQFQELGGSALERFKDFFGEVREDMVEKVQTRLFEDDLLVEKYNEFYRKLKEPERVRELAKLLNEGRSLEEAAEEAEVEPGELKELRLEAIRTGELKPNPRGRYNSEKFREFRRRVKKLTAANPGISHEEIARRLNRKSRKRVVVAVASLKKEGAIPYDQKTAAARRRYREQAGLREKIYAAILSKNPSDSELAKEFGVPTFRIQYHKAVLRKQGRIKDKRQEYRDNLKNQVRDFLNECAVNHPGESVSISAQLKKINYRTALSLYHEIASEQEVPGLRVGPRRKKQT